MDQDTGQLYGVVMITIVGGSILAAIWRAGVFGPRAFEAAPKRRGALGLFDPFVAVAVLLVGMAAVGSFVGQPPPEDQMTPRRMFITMVATQAGALPAIVYILIRAGMVVEGGLLGFGFDPRRFGAAVRYALLGTVTAIPLTMAVSAIVMFVMQQLGLDAPQIAHEALRKMTEEGWGPTRWGLIISAVVLAPIVEETIFRGMWQTALLQSKVVLTPWAAIGITSVIFTLTHVQIANLNALPALFTLSLGLGYVYERSGSLLAPMLLHAIFNGLQIIIALNLPQTPAAS
ncbi:CPBP family intramembrane metalloprotease [Planctomycetales bacterium ZRK34]|nr:CPBP family intramembrane metalloprotease [Planctomycetales bacterium ZRK34]